MRYNPSMSRSFGAALLAGLALFGAGVWGGVRWASRPDRVRSQFHILYHRHGEETYNNTHWLGTEVQKCPFDLWTYEEILNETRPDVLIEMGTFKGGSALYFASLFDLMKHGRVITIDIEDQPGKPQHDRITYLLGSSTAPEIVAKVKSLIQPGERVMVSLDSDHRAAHVSKELSIYSEMVTPGSYLVVEDTHFNGHPILPHFGPGPHEAVDAFLAGHPEFAPDASREHFLMTFSPGGYLKRLR